MARHGTRITLQRRLARVLNADEPRSNLNTRLISQWKSDTCNFQIYVGQKSDRKIGVLKRFNHGMLVKADLVEMLKLGQETIYAKNQFVQENLYSLFINTVNARFEITDMYGISFRLSRDMPSLICLTYVRANMQYNAEISGLIQGNTILTTNKTIEIRIKRNNKFTSHVCAIPSRIGNELPAYHLSFANFLKMVKYLSVN